LLAIKISHKVGYYKSDFREIFRDIYKNKISISKFIKSGRSKVVTNTAVTVTIVAIDVLKVMLKPEGRFFMQKLLLT